MPADYRETLFTRRGLYPRRFRAGERQTFERLMLQFGRRLETRLIALCPVDKGDLRDSIGVNVTIADLTIRVRMLFYGRWVRRGNRFIDQAKRVEARWVQGRIRALFPDQTAEERRQRERDQERLRRERERAYRKERERRRKLREAREDRAAPNSVAFLPMLDVCGSISAMTTPNVPAQGRPLFARLQLTNVQASDEGRLRAVIAHINQRNQNGYLWLPGSIGNQSIMGSRWNHGSFLSYEEPVSKGSVVEDGELVSIDVQYDMDDPRSAASFRRIRNDPDTEYSLGVYNTGEVEYRENEDGQRTIAFHSVRAAEYSPVIMGADLDTYTIGTNGVNELSQWLSTISDPTPPEPADAPPEGMDAIMARIMTAYMGGYRYA